MIVLPSSMWATWQPEQFENESATPLLVGTQRIPKISPVGRIVVRDGSNVSPLRAAAIHLGSSVRSARWSSSSNTRRPAEIQSVSVQLASGCDQRLRSDTLQHFPVAGRLAVRQIHRIRPQVLGRQRVVFLRADVRRAHVQPGDRRSPVGERRVIPRPWDLWFPSLRISPRRAEETTQNDEGHQQSRWESRLCAAHSVLLETPCTSPARPVYDISPRRDRQTTRCQAARVEAG